MRKLFFLLIMSLALKSCVIDFMPWGYSVRNCTKDTLYVDLTVSDTLTDNVYWGMHPGDTAEDIVTWDTTSVYIHGEKVILNDFFCALPDSTSGYIYPIGEDTSYIYTIKKSIITRYTLDEIRKMRLYDRRVVTKKDFKRHIYDYRVGGTGT